MTNSCSLIAITGQAGVGKTTVAQRLVTHHHYIRVRFADGLKKMLRTLGLTEDEIDGDLKEKPCTLLLGVTPRRAMQTLGTEWGRDLMHPDLWSNIWKARVTEQLLLGHKVVCDDCRFENEVRFIKSFVSSEIWSVRRALAVGNTMTHSSEAEAASLPQDRIVSNYGTVDQLNAYVDEIITKG